MHTWSVVIAAIVLFSLWALEGSQFALTKTAVPLGQRMRHVILALLNLVVSAAAVFFLAVADVTAKHADFGLLRCTSLPWWIEFVCALLLLDLWQYVMHVVAHHVPVLWRMHAVHHSAPYVEATVSLRFHTGEVAWNAVAIVLFSLAMGISIEHVAAYNAILTAASFFHHANIRLSPVVDRFLGGFLVTPGMHRVHHSRWTPETDSNYGAVLPIWDRLFGTLRLHPHPEEISVGLDGYTEDEVNHISGMLSAPFGQSISGYGSPTSHSRPLQPTQTTSALPQP